MARNWAGTYEYRAPRIEPARDVDDVRRLLQGTGPVHTLGTRHSFTDLPDTPGTLIDVSGLVGGFALDEDARTVTVAAGTRYGDLAIWLDERGWALHNLGSLPHISVGGATSTGTHGSGNGNGVLTTAVRGIRFIGADGEPREVRPGDPDFAALAVGVGAFGVIVSLDLAVEPAYRVRQDVYRGLTWEAFLADPDAITGAGYSVSVFTEWDAASVGHVWVKTRLAADDDPVPDTISASVRDAVAGGDPLTPVLGDNITEQGGVPGPWNVRLPHFRLDATPSYGDEIQTEYFVPRTDAAAALAAVLALAPAIRPHLLVSELRTAAADDLWLSGAYQRDFLAIHFTWRNEPSGVWEVLPLIEAALAPFAARPHWGKLHRFDAARIAAVHPRLADARAVFERLDPDGRFVNEHLVRVGLRDPR